MADDDSKTVEGAPQVENTCAGCGLPAKMACPHCVKIKASEPQDFTTDYGVAYYCAQDCFKKHWKTHKTQHKPWAAAVEIATPSAGWQRTDAILLRQLRGVDRFVATLG